MAEKHRYPALKFHLWSVYTSKDDELLLIEYAGRAAGKQIKAAKGATDGRA